ncbi:hypothetical protein ACLOJK_041104 [Asimina triloba]
MAGNQLDSELSSFLESGIYRFLSQNAIFMDPVRVLNESYSRFQLSPSAYYTRFFALPRKDEDGDAVRVSPGRRKKKRKRIDRDLNEREISAEKRHQAYSPFSLSPMKLKGIYFIVLSKDIELTSEISYQEARPFLLRAHKELLEANDLLPFMWNLKRDESGLVEMKDSSCADEYSELSFVDLGSISKTSYPTLPNRYFLSLPVKQLTHTGGALVALWVTNREKLRAFAEKELFPAWGIMNVTQLYWLKVKADGSLIGELDLFHHRPYECVLLGYSHGKAICCPYFSDLEADSEQQRTHKPLHGNQVLISIPGDHSRKPPLGRPMPARCIELFARELTAGWTSWGNETLRLQDSRYFLDKLNKKMAKE